MGEKHTLENGMELLKEQLPNVANAFGLLRDEATKDGVLSARRTLHPSTCKGGC